MYKPTSSKVPPPSFEQMSELAMHVSISPPQNFGKDKAIKTIKLISLNRFLRVQNEQFSEKKGLIFT